MTARERAARRVNGGREPIAPGKPGNAPATDYEASEHKAARVELSIWIMQRNLSMIAQAVCAAAGLAGLLLSGWHEAVLGAVGVWLFGLCRPPPSDTLDKHTNRKGR